jgi:hypothetical protein
MNVPRRFHAAMLLPNGKVLVADGQNNGLTPLASAELFDPVTGKWTPTAPLGTIRVSQLTTLLPNGNALVAGGQSTNFDVTPISEVYDIGLGFSTNWQPQIRTATSPLSLNSSLALSGTQFRGVSRGSGGNGSPDSPSDYPVLQLRSFESDQMLNLSATNWDANFYSSVALTNFPAGWAMATVFVNGIPSASRILLVTTPAPTPIALTNPVRLGNGSFQFGFTNTPGAAFTVFATTNAALDLSNWTVLGNPTEVSIGQFQFTDPQSTNHLRRFYRVSSP